MIKEIFVLVICGITEFKECGAIETAKNIKNIIFQKCKDTACKLVYKELLGTNANQRNVETYLNEAAQYLIYPNRKAIIFYNGHGDQKPDLNKDENDGKDEFWRLMGGGVILDDDLSLFFNKIHDKSFLFLISDCCSSGTMLDIKLNNRPWICLSSCNDNEDSLASSAGGIFTIFGLLPAISKYNNLADICDYIKQNINIQTQNYYIQVTREYLWTVDIF